MAMLKRKLQLILLALILTVATIIGPACKDPEKGKKSSSEVDWGIVIFIIRAVYHNHDIDKDPPIKGNIEPQKLVKLDRPSGSNKTDITDTGEAAGEAAGTGGGHC